MKRVIAITLGLGGVAAAAFLMLRHEETGVDVVEAPLSPFVPSKPRLVAAGAELKERAHAFVAVDDGFAAEGVKVAPDGTVTFTAQKDGTRLVQTPVAARVVDKTQTVEDFPANIGTGIIKDEQGASSVLFKDRLGSVDLEYRYDGVQMEEFFHVDSTLAGKLAEAGHDLELSSRFPTLTESAGAVLLDDATGALLEALINYFPESRRRLLRKAAEKQKVNRTAGGIRPGIGRQEYGVGDNLLAG